MSQPTELQDPAQCAECGTPLTHNICPACLLKRGGSLIAESKKRNRPGDFTPPKPDDLQLLFPEFQISRLIGRGGMGAVYQAHQVDLEREVAIKILPPEAASDPEFQERFRREAATLAQLDHPNIVSLFDFGEREGFFYFVMEYIEGADLAALMAQDEFTPEDILAMISQICDALDYSHQRGVVHRDIKPGNILIDREGRAKIVDFGLAKVVRGDVVDPGLTRTHSSMGTPQYMAPEQMAGSANVDHRSDIYALGVVLYELLTGKIPGGHFKTPSEQKPTLNPRLDQVVLRALKDEPEQRYQQASDIKSSLQEALEKPEDSPRKKARLMTYKIIGTAFFTSLLGGLAVWWFSHRDNQNGPSSLEAHYPGKVFQVTQYDTKGKLIPTIPALAKGASMVALSGSRESFGVAIDARGVVVAWGANRYGQASPPPGLHAIAVAAGQGPRNAHALALQANGTVVAWGDDTFGQASPPPGLDQVVQIAAGETFSLALRKTGEVVTWGRLAPAPSQKIAEIAAGTKFAAAILRDGTLIAWGEDAPAVSGKATRLAAGHEHLLALQDDGAVKTWRMNAPAKLPPTSAIFAGVNQSASLTADGQLRFWGKEDLLSEVKNAHAISIGWNSFLVLTRDGPF